MTEQADKIIIVDDDVGIRDLLARWLQKEGYHCRTAESGRTALKLLAEDHCNLLVTDVNMPEMTGLELHRQVRERFADLAVIMVTAVDDRDIAIHALQNGAYGYVIKPFDRTEVLISVTNALQLRSRAIKNKARRQELERLLAEKTAELEMTQAELNSTRTRLRELEKRRAT